MFKIKFTLAIVAALSFTFINKSAAQDVEFRKFGLGVAYSPFDMTSIFGSAAVMPITGINFALNAAPNFRSELTIGLSNTDIKTDKEKRNLFSAGLGLFYTKRIEASVLMGGLRIEYLTGKSELYAGMNQFMNSDIQRLSYGPAFSYEHLFDKHFGLGAEVGVRAANYKESSELPGEPESEFKVDALYMQNTIFIRGYF
jgi:hypothetical protein